MYEIYQKILDEKKLKNSDVARGAKVSNMTLSDWKRGNTIPKTDTMKKIADFLGVTVDYLMTGKEEEFFQENAQLLVELRRDKELSKALLKYFQLSQEQKKHIVDSINLLGKED
jgi:transcriptional regulator with XRE-family HTH domain